MPVLLLLVLVDCYIDRGIAKGIMPCEAYFTSRVCVSFFKSSVGYGLLSGEKEDYLGCLNHREERPLCVMCFRQIFT